MKKLTNRLISTLLAVIMMAGSISCGYFAYAIPYQEGDTLPHYDADNEVYTRLSNGVPISFYTSFDYIVDEFERHLKNRDENFTVMFATDDADFAYNPADPDDYSEKAYRLINRTLHRVFSENNDDPFGGDYLYHTLNMSGKGFTPAFRVFATKDDKIGDKQYYCYEIGLQDVDYYINKEQEQYFEAFVKKFKERYIDANANVFDSNDDYWKVKTIYDFVVRNASYDYVTYDNKDNDNYDHEGVVFKTAHSAYGAICGKIPVPTDQNYFAEQYDSGKLNMDKHFDEYYNTAITVEGQLVEDYYNRGLAVCEGYSKLFYALCIYVGIDCHIIDGDYADGTLNPDGSRKSDAHEWNVVRINNSREWYQVDTTFASQQSVKEIDYNNYDFFLVGTGNYYMDPQRHQVPYACEYDENTGDTIVYHNNMMNDHEHQLYDWNKGKSNTLSYYDYKHPSDYKFMDDEKQENTADLKNGILVSRSYEYKGETKTSFILYKKDAKKAFVQNVIINEDGVSISDINAGFVYRSLKDIEYTYIYRVPYVINEVIKPPVSSNQSYLVDAGKYSEHIGNLNFDVPIIQLDMTGDPTNKNNNYSSSTRMNEGSDFTGSKITPQATIRDGFDTLLVEGKDYEIRYYSDASYTYEIKEIKNVGSYYISVDYRGNYSGNYRFPFTVNKIGVDKIEYPITNFTYIPKALRPAGNINNIRDYFIRGYSGGSNIGESTVIKPNEDYSVDYHVQTGGSTGLDYNSTGVIEITGLSGSSCIIPGSKKYVNYTISDQFDIGNSSNGFNGLLASSKAYTYTGSPITPQTFDNLNVVLASDECKVVSYSNNVNAGNATVVVDGDGGCNGRAYMYFVIAKKQISDDMISIRQENGNLVVKLSYNGMVLKNGVDYVTNKVGDTITISAASNSNYSGSYAILLRGASDINVVYDDSATNTTTTTNTNTSTTIVTNTTAPALPKPKTIELSKSIFVYNGKTQKPTVKVKDTNGKVMPSYYYTVSIPSSKKMGSYKVTVKFRNGISGSMTKSYTIGPKGTTISSVSAGKKTATVKWKKQTSNTTGYEIRYSTNKNMSKAKTVSVSKNKTTSAKFSKLTSKKTYYFQIRTYKKDGKKVYRSDWSKAKSIKIK